MSSPNSRPRLMIVGGFLGAGKTTTIARLAAKLQGSGRTFGIVTNDQGSDLVDTLFLRAQGLQVDEVTGGCFCCNYNAFVEALSRFREKVDVVLAEPVGSCTDLVATLFRPLRTQLATDFALAPLAVVIDPRRARRYLTHGGSPEINYLFQKQVEEADILLLNKCDTLTGAEADELATRLRDRFPGREVIHVSARTGDGFDALAELLATSSGADAPLEISYERYGESEAALGWINLNARALECASIDPNTVAADVLARIGRESRRLGWDVAHAKIYLVGGLDHAKASLVSADEHPIVDVRMENRPQSLEIVLNARVAAPPAELRGVCESAIREALADAGLAGRPAFQGAAFSPSFPNPTHRMTR